MTEKEKEQFVRRLYGVYEESGMTQKELADKIGLGSRSTLANYLAGTPIPSDKLHNFCKVMNCSADYLFGFDTNNTISLEGLSPTMVREVRIYIEAARFLKSNQ